MQKQLIRVSFYPATVFGSPVGENPQEPHSLGIVERQALSLRKSAAVRAVFSGYTLAKPTLAWVSIPVC